MKSSANARKQGLTLVLDGHSLAIEDVVRAARNREQIAMHPEAVARLVKCRSLLERKIESGEVMYGVNTGVGELAEVRLTPEQVQQYQRYILYSHAAGCGEPCSEEDARAGMISRLNTHCWGHSGIRLEVVQTQIDMLNKGVTPVMCQKGSVGACGDLAPMSQMAITLMGEGEVFYQGKRMPAKTGMDKAGIPTIVFRERDGLAAINGSDLITGMGCIQLYDAERLLRTQEVALAMTLQSLNPAAPPLYLYIAKNEFTRANLAAGQVITAHARPYGVAFTALDAANTFAVVLDDASIKDLNPNPVEI